MEEFTFKPLTEGLGFHNKKERTKKNTKPNESLPVPLNLESAELKTSGELNTKSLKSPLPKKEILPSALETPSKEVIDDLVRNFKKSKEAPKEITKGTQRELPQKPQVIINPVMPLEIEEETPLPWMVSPFIVDAMLVLALVLSSLMAILLITKVDLIKIMTENPDDIELWFSLPITAIIMCLSYMSLTRLILGSSLGELIFDIQVGTDEQRDKLSFNFLVFGRSLIALCTGLFILPILSLIMRKDYLGTFSGLKLYKKQ